MSVPVATLQALQPDFTATRVGPEVVQPGQPVRVRLTPSEGLHVTELLPGELSLTWITKNVVFNTDDIEPAFADSPFDPTDLAGVMVAGPTVPPTTGVPGTLSQLAGTVPVSAEVPVVVRVSWSVHTQSGAAVATGFSAPQGTAGPDVSFVFTPQTVELTSGLTVPVVRRFIRATVTLAAGGTQAPPFSPPDIPVDIPAIPIPTVVAFFLHRNFAAASGAAFIVVPDNSPLKSLAELQGALNTLQSALGLTSVANLAAFLLGIQELSNALAAQPHVQFRVTRNNTFNRFESVTLIQRWLLGNPFGGGDTEAEDELSSLIFVGTQGKGLECFNDRDCVRGEGTFTLRTGRKQHALVRDLHHKNPVSGPDASEITVDVVPPGGFFNADHFGDNLSSMRFLPRVVSNLPSEGM